MGKIVKYMDHKIGWTARINNAVAYTYGDMFLFGEQHILKDRKRRPEGEVNENLKFLLKYLVSVPNSNPKK
jgi:hypothetical protein